MQTNASNTDDELSDSSPPVTRSSADRRHLDRRTLVHGAGAVLFAGSFAGCTDDDDDGSGDSDEGNDDDGGGPYAVGGRSASTG